MKINGKNRYKKTLSNLNENLKLVVQSFYLLCSCSLVSLMFCSNIAMLLSDLISHFLQMLDIVFFASLFRMQNKKSIIFTLL
jgi:hypothetical protein